MPKLIRKAIVTLTAAELSKALGVPFEQIEQVEWYTATDGLRGLKLTLSIEEDMKLPRVLEHKK